MERKNDEQEREMEIGENVRMERRREREGETKRGERILGARVKRCLCTTRLYIYIF